MTTTIQLLIVAGLVVAWVAMIGWPGSARASLVTRWRRRPLEVRRREWLLATTFATFASFLLAVALRGRFAYLFAMMALLLIGHVVVAARIGSGSVAARQALRSTANARRASRRLQPEGIRIKARQLVPDPAGLVSDLIEEQWGDEIEAEPQPVEPQPESQPEPEPAPAPAPKPTVAERIFTRAAKDAPPRSRRAARAIHIESQLDDDTDTPPKAVNDR